MTAVQRPEENSPAEADLAGSQAGRPSLQSGQKRTKLPRRRIRRSIVGLLLALSSILVVLSTTVVWAHRTVLNTGTFVGTVGPVFKHPGVDSAVATRATDKLFTEINLQARLRAALPPKASFAAVPLANATKGFVADELTKVLASPQFQAVWTGTLTTTHQQLVAVLRGQNTEAVSTSGGYIVLNTVPVIKPGAEESVGPGLRVDRQARDVAHHHQRGTAAAGGEQAVQGAGSPAARQLRRDQAGPVE
jgi:hypothetical protein